MTTTLSAKYNSLPCWFLAKIRSIFVSLPWKLDSPYCHTLGHLFQFSNFKVDYENVVNIVVCKKNKSKSNGHIYKSIIFRKTLLLAILNCILTKHLTTVLPSCIIAIQIISLNMVNKKLILGIGENMSWTIAPILYSQSRIFFDQSKRTMRVIFRNWWNHVANNLLRGNFYIM